MRKLMQTFPLSLSRVVVCHAVRCTMWECGTDHIFINGHCFTNGTVFDLCCGEHGDTVAESARTFFTCLFWRTGGKVFVVFFHSACVHMSITRTCFQFGYVARREGGCTDLTGWQDSLFVSSRGFFVSFCQERSGQSGRGAEVTSLKEDGEAGAHHFIVQRSNARRKRAKRKTICVSK